MNGTLDSKDRAEEQESKLDPRAAAELLTQTGKQAQRQLTPNPLWLRVFVAFLVFVLYGCVYMSVRNQHPYFGPRGTWLVIMAVIFVLSSLLRLVVFGNAMSGVGGMSAQRMKGLAIAIAAAVVCVYTLDAGLSQAHAAKTITVGVFDAAGPLLVLSALWAGIEASRENWRDLGAAVALMAVATGAAFAGPRGVWAVIAIGGAAVLLASIGIELAISRGYWTPLKPINS